MTGWRRRGRPPEPGRHRCQRCAAAFRPALTHGDCPVCGLVADARFQRQSVDAEVRPVVLAIAAMAVNLVIFAGVAWAVLG